MMKESKTELEQNIDEIIESSRKISNIFYFGNCQID